MLRFVFVVKFSYFVICAAYSFAFEDIPRFVLVSCVAIFIFFFVPNVVLLVF